VGQRGDGAGADGESRVMAASREVSPQATACQHSSSVARSSLRELSCLPWTGPHTVAIAAGLWVAR